MFIAIALLHVPYRLSTIYCDIAFFFYLRRESGNQAISRYVMLDELHMRAALPIGFLPGHLNCILDAIGWPVEDAEDRFNRIIRVEALPLVEELLSTGYIGFERASNG